MVGVAQLVRAPDCGSEGREFKSPRPPFFDLFSDLGLTNRSDGAGAAEL